MAKDSKRFGLLQSCPDCLSIFTICHPCFRGQKYCSTACRKQARSAQVKAAGARYQGTPEAQRKQRFRQNAYRHRLKNVTHQSSQKNETELADGTLHRNVSGARALVICRYCNRPVNFLMNSAVGSPTSFMRHKKSLKRKKYDQQRN
jgi:hypothetical protein